MTLNKSKLIFIILSFTLTAIILTGCQKTQGTATSIFKEMQELAKQGDAGDQYNLGMMYEYGHGVEKDYT